jgi:hypothetical protein
MANIPIDGLFINADSGFDSKDFRNICAGKEVFANVDFNTGNGELDNDNLLDEELYNERYSIERSRCNIGKNCVLYFLYTLTTQATYLHCLI